MRQSLSFVPFRLAIAAVLILFAALSNGQAATQVIFVAANDEKIDPIITGASTASNAMDEWRAAKKRFEECGLCGEEQPFPGDLPQ